jgi:hypothetical protein
METQEIIQIAKKAGSRVFQAKIAGVDTIYRSISRKEFRDLQTVLAQKTEKIKKADPDGAEAKIALLKEEGEEMLVLKGCLVPKFDTELDLATVPAGFVPSAAELIMSGSGFGAEIEPKEL